MFYRILKSIFYNPEAPKAKLTNEGRAVVEEITHKYFGSLKLNSLDAVEVSASDLRGIASIISLDPNAKNPLKENIVQVEPARELADFYKKNEKKFTEQVTSLFFRVLNSIFYNPEAPKATLATEGRALVEEIAHKHFSTLNLSSLNAVEASSQSLEGSAISGSPESFEGIQLGSLFSFSALNLAASKVSSFFKTALPSFLTKALVAGDQRASYPLLDHVSHASQNSTLIHNTTFEQVLADQSASEAKESVSHLPQAVLFALMMAYCIGKGIKAYKARKKSLEEKSASMARIDAFVDGITIKNISCYGVDIDKLSENRKVFLRSFMLSSLSISRLP